MPEDAKRETREPRRCTELTKNGEPCQGPVLKDATYCLAHAPEEVRQSKGFGGPQEGAGRPKNPRMVDVLRERMEAELDEWLEVLHDARSAERGLVVGNGPTAHVDFVPDHATRLAAFREAFDRAFGKPKQQTELTGPDGGAVQTEVTLPEGVDWHAQVASVLAEAGALRADGDRPDQD